MRYGLGAAALLAAAVAAGAPALADDYAAGPETEGALSVGGSATGELEAPGDTDWFAVILEEGQGYAIDLEGAPTGQGTLPDPLITLYDADGTEVGRNDDGGTGFNSRLIFTAPAAGTYYVAAGGFADAIGTYTVRVGEFDAPPDDYAASVDTAGEVAVGGEVTGALELPGDSDWFRLEVTGGQQYEVRLEGAPTDMGTLGDPLVTLYDAEGNEIDRDDDGGEGFNSRLILSPAQDATRFIGAQGFGDVTGTYTLSVREYVPPPDDYADGPDTSGAVTVGGSVTGEIGTPDDQDWFAVTLEAGQGYAIDVEGSDTGMGTLPDPYAFLYDADGNQLAQDDDGGQGFNSRLLYTPQQSGTYYAAAASFGEATGTYTLGVSEYVPPPDDYGDMPDAAGAVAPGESVTGEIEVMDDIDLFGVELRAGVPYTFDLEGAPTGQGTLGDTVLILLDADGNEILYNDDFGGSFNSQITFTPPQAGTYYLAARGFGQNTGSYTLTVSGPGGGGGAGGPNIEIIVEMTDGQRIRLVVPRTYLPEVDSIYIGPEMME